MIFLIFYPLSGFIKPNSGYSQIKILVHKNWRYIIVALENIFHFDGEAEYKQILQVQGNKSIKKCYTKCPEYTKNWLLICLQSLGDIWAEYMINWDYRDNEEKHSGVKVCNSLNKQEVV